MIGPEQSAIAERPLQPVGGVGQVGIGSRKQGHQQHQRKHNQQHRSAERGQPVAQDQTQCRHVLTVGSSQLWARSARRLKITYEAATSDKNLTKLVSPDAKITLNDEEAKFCDQCGAPL